MYLYSLILWCNQIKYNLVKSSVGWVEHEVPLNKVFFGLWRKLKRRRKAMEAKLDQLLERGFKVGHFARFRLQLRWFGIEVNGG